MLRTSLGSLAILAALLCAVGISGPPVRAQAVDAPPALASAIKAYVEGRGNQFAGDCRQAQTGQSAGQYCYTVVALTAQSAEVRVGQALSDETTPVSFQNVNGTWQVVGGSPTATPTRTSTATATATAGGAAAPSVSPSPPKTGNGGSSNGSPWPLAGASLVVVAIAVAGFSRLTVRKV